MKHNPFFAGLLKLIGVDKHTSVDYLIELGAGVLKCRGRAPDFSKLLTRIGEETVWGEIMSF